MQNRSRTEYSILNILAGVGGYFLNTVLGFVCRIVFVQCLSADYLGVNGLFTNILTMFSLAELGVGSAVVYALYKPLAENDEARIASLMRLYAKAYRTIGLLIGAVGLALMPFLNVIIREQPNISESIYLLYAINLFNTASSYFFSYRSSLLIAAQRNYIVAGISYAISLVQSILQMVFLLVFHNYIIYLFIQTAGTLLYNVVVSRVSMKQFPFIRGKNAPPLPEQERRALFANVRDLMVYKVSGLLVNSTDNILITFFNDLATTGIASNYTLLVNTLNSLLGQVFNGLTASIGNHNASEPVEKRYQMFSFLNMMNFWIFGWAALGILFCSSDLVQLCFGEEYVLPTAIPFVLALNFFASGVTNILGTYKHTLGLFHYGRFIQVITGILNIILSVILGHVLGLFGIFAATVIARIATHLWYTPYVVYKYGFGIRVSEYWRDYFRYLGLVLVSAALCYFLFHFLSGALLAQTILKILLCSIVTNGVFFLGLHKTNEFTKIKQYLITIVQRVCDKRGRR